MGKDSPQTDVSLVKNCPKLLLSSYPVLYPTYTSLAFKNLKNAVNFGLDFEQSCNQDRQTDKSKRTRNRRLLELPFKAPKCCNDIYNANLDRQKRKKLAKFGLTLPEKRTEIPGLKVCEDVVEEDEEEEEGEGEDKTEGTVKKITLFPECFLLKETDSETEEEEEYKTCSSGSESDCSGCSTLGPQKRAKRHEVVKKDLQELLHPPPDPCRGIAQEELKKHQERFF